MSSTRESVLQSVRAFLRAHASRAPLTHAQVIAADERGHRPSGAYLSVRVDSADREVGTDDVIQVTGDALVVTAGTTGDVYAVTVDAESVTVTQEAGDDASDIAAALAAALDDLEGVSAASDGSSLWVVAETGDLELSTTTDAIDVEVGAVTAYVVRAERAATVSVEAYGDQAVAWLERATRHTSSPSGLATLDGAGIAMRPIGPLIDVAALTGDRTEARATRDFEITYLEVGDAVAAIVATSIETTTETSVYDVADALTIDASISLEE